MFNPFYLTAAEARAEGYTHEGKLFDVPVWLADVGRGNVPRATAKLLPLNWLLIATANVLALCFELRNNPVPPQFLLRNIRLIKDSTS